MAAPPDLIAALKELDEALPGYETADSFYEGDAGEVFATDVIRRLLVKAGTNEIDDLNYARIPVDTVANGLQIQSITAVTGDQAVTAEDGEQTAGGSDKADEDAQERLDELLKTNQLRSELKGLFRAVSRHGDAYLLIWPVTEDTEDGTPPGEGTAGPRTVGVDIRVNTADTVRVIYDEEDPLKPRYAVKRWETTLQDGSKAVRANLYYPDKVEKWIVREAGDQRREQDWVKYYDRDPSTEAGPEDLDGPQPDEVAGPDGEEPGEWPLDNPTGRIPFFHFRNDRPYGTPEHRSAYGPQQLINKLIKTFAATIDYQGFPQRYALIDPKQDQVLQNVIDPNYPEDEDDDPEGPGNSSVLRSDPSAVWRLPGMSGVGQFNPADPQNFLAPLDRFVRAMAELTDVPLHRFGSGFGQTPSGEALRVVDAPRVTRLLDRQDEYGETLADGLEFALELLGYSDVTVQVRWRPAMAATTQDDWAIVAAKIANGVPARQALVEAGYSDDEVDGWLESEEGSDLERMVDLLVKIGTAIQSVGAGIGLGAISSEEAQRVINLMVKRLEEGQKMPAFKPFEPPPPPAPPGLALPGQDPAAAKKTTPKKAVFKTTRPAVAEEKETTGGA